METTTNVVKMGLKNKAFSATDVAELVYGKVGTNIGQVDTTAKKGIMLISWQVHNFTRLPVDVRQEILMKMSYITDFCHERILCALGYISPYTKEYEATIIAAKMRWQKVYTPISPKGRHWNATDLLKEILLWHEWGLNYSYDEYQLLHQRLEEELATHHSWFEKLPAKKRHYLTQTLELKITPNSSLQKVPFKAMYGWLIEMKYNADPAD